jgi:uncharacterized membrane protein
MRTVGDQSHVGFGAKHQVYQPISVSTRRTLRGSNSTEGHRSRENGATGLPWAEIKGNCFCSGVLSWFNKKRVIIEGRIHDSIRFLPSSSSRRGQERATMKIVKTLTRFLFGLLFVVAGVLHFVNPAFYLKIMPPDLPWHLELVYVSGLFEIGLGALLLMQKWARLAAWGLILLLIAVFPANIYVYQHQEILPRVSPLWHFMRLPLQGVLILWAYWYTRPDKSQELKAD